MMRKPLGRGLDALIGTAAAGIEIGADNESGAGGGGAHFRMAPVASITAGPFQPRINFDAERLAELTRAIQSQGIIEPLIVRRIADASAAAGEIDGPRYELIAGERRLRAARAAGLEAVPVVVRELDDRAALEMSLVENIVREDLNAVEEGLAFFRLVEHFKLTQDEIAARVGKSRPYVSNTLRLLELPQPILNMIAKGQLTAGQARPTRKSQVSHERNRDALSLALGALKNARRSALSLMPPEIVFLRHPDRSLRSGGTPDPSLARMPRPLLTSPELGCSVPRDF